MLIVFHVSPSDNAQDLLCSGSIHLWDGQNGKFVLRRNKINDLQYFFGTTMVAEH